MIEVAETCEGRKVPENRISPKSGSSVDIHIDLFCFIEVRALGLVVRRRVRLLEVRCALAVHQICSVRGVRLISLEARQICSVRGVRLISLEVHLISLEVRQICSVRGVHLISLGVRRNGLVQVAHQISLEVRRNGLVQVAHQISLEVRLISWARVVQMIVRGGPLEKGSLQLRLHLQTWRRSVGIHCRFP
jgi:hypothetical protein